MIALENARRQKIWRPAAELAVKMTFDAARGLRKRRLAGLECTKKPPDTLL